jgi:putative endonuclease
VRHRVFYVYILANRYNNVLYTGVTNNLYRRCCEHKEKRNRGFTQKYNVDKLVYYEKFTRILEAIHREKQIKAYRREKKVALIVSMNSEWKDLFQDISQDSLRPII